MQRTETNNIDNEDYEIDLVHYRQKYSWDCGLSCIMMVLPERKRDFFINNFDEICGEEGFGKSTWTIDLCYLLKRFSMDFVFYTAYQGVNPEHKSMFFYERILNQDRDRVTQRFKDAIKNGIDIKQKSVKISDMINHIKKNGPVIVLTNAGYLHCKRCKKNSSASKFINYFPSSIKYHGHYVVLCGYNLKNNQFYYKNPAYSNRTCVIEMSAMNKARLCYGTDEDCIFVFL